MNQYLSNGASRKVLIVDDAESVADFLRELLLSLDHDAEVSFSVEDALKRFQPGKYDLVVTDYNMPGMSGLEFAQAIRERASQQPILLITGDCLQAEKKCGGARHFNATLQKPFSLTEFQETLTGIFSTGC